MTVERRIRLEVNPGLDDRLAGRLGAQAALDGLQDLGIGELEGGYVETIEIT